MLDPQLTFLAQRLGFSLPRDETCDTILHLVRHQHRFQLNVTTDYQVNAWALWAARLVADQLQSTYDVSTEHLNDSKPRNIYEVPSPHGDREQFLLPVTVAEGVERMTGWKLFRKEAPDRRFCVVYSLEEGLGLHLLFTRDLEQMAFSAEEIDTRTRLAHFYASYKMKPIARLRVEQVGVVKVYGSADGRTGARALLFPDFDWDAAQDNGVMFLPSRDLLLVGEPVDEKFSQEVRFLTAATLAHILDTPFDAFFASNLQVLAWGDVATPALLSYLNTLKWNDRQRSWCRQIPYYHDPYLLSPDGMTIPTYDDITPPPLPIELLT